MPLPSQAVIIYQYLWYILNSPMNSNIYQMLLTLKNEDSFSTLENKRNENIKSFICFLLEQVTRDFKLL